MNLPDIVNIAADSRTDFLRLRTLTLIRWTAIAGQVAALLVADPIYGIDLPLGMCLLVVGASAIANLVFTFLYPQNTRLTDQQVFLVLLFDLAQLAALLWLTGGLSNPFALLILAPVTISATTLEGRATMILGATAVALVSVLAWSALPLVLPGTGELAMPPLFAVGFWLAIVIGIAFLGSYAHRVSAEIRSMQKALLATQMALAREQKLTDLGGVVAAAAHELGTPLATIKLVSAELMEELDDLPDLRADAELIREQADRCRDILRSMGRAGKDDRHLRQAPLSVVLREAAEPHLSRGKTVHFLLEGPDPAEREPDILRRPEIIHGLRNLIQNAVDFAASDVWAEARWSDGHLTLRIVDDGPGYPPHVIGRIGDPFMRSRRPSDTAQRPEYEGMGLGLFIAKTLLERSGAELTFANGGPEAAPRSGAIVELTWPMARIAAAREALGENTPNH
ncbi:sensor histidine kinase RegB [Gemmobacter denitrificans]|uniref:histidine kinase n=1 Tax=Gemmobacter denitrificans TaxID=3123040 RepID=A0ABU8BX82_9RHOB